jgi:hypothetical protein
MKTNLLLLLWCCLLSASAPAQDLLHSRQSSAFTYLYQITNEQAADICRADSWLPDPAFFHTLRDSFPSDSAMNLRLPPGHYLQTRIVKNRLVAGLLTVQFFDVVALDNGADLCLAVYDTLGRVLPDAVLKIDGRRIPFDARSQSYRHPKSNAKGQLTVTCGGLTTFYNLDRHWNNPLIRRVANRPPLRYVYRPIRLAVRVTADSFRSLIRGYPGWLTRRVGNFFACWFDDDYCRRSQEERFAEKWRGYMVFSKPKYMPGDTVRLKTFIANTQGIPLDDSVNVVLYKSWNTPLTLARIAPYSPGAFEFSFPLHDSLGLRLDQSYRIALERKKGWTYFGGSFHYEDYELKTASLALRTEGETQYRGLPFPLFLKGTDENELNLPDARLELTLLPVKAFRYHEPLVFIPDTLWRWEQALAPSGEAEIIVPDSLFPAADLEYRLEAVMLTSDNERVEKEENIRFYHKRREFRLTPLRDSVRFEYLENGHALPAQALFSSLDPLGNPVEERLAVLPFTEKINPWYTNYRLDDGSFRQDLSLSDEPSELQCFTGRSADTLHIAIDNPRQLPFRYFLYRKNREIQRGYGTALNLVRRSGQRESYSLNLQYLWAGKLKSENYAIGLRRRQLRVEIDQPAVVYPGQTTEIAVKVTDQRGQPVSGADVTAFGVTQKFDPRPPVVPSFDKKLKGRRFINKFMTWVHEETEYSALLDFPAWAAKAGLGTIEYYRFIYPGREVYRYEYPAPDSATQFAPFVVKNGALQAVHTVYVDQKPVYFGWSDNYRPYSFPVTPGYHSVLLRTTDRLVWLDSLYFAPYQKLIFSVGDSVRSPKVIITPMPGELTANERNNLYRYIFPYRNTFGEALANLEQKKDLIALWPAPSSNTRQYQRFAGPVMPDSAVMRVPEGYETRFVHEPFMEYDFAPGLLKMRSVEASKRYPARLSGAPVETLGDVPLSADHLSRLHLQAKENKRRLKKVFVNPSATLSGRGRLELETPASSDVKAALNTLLFQREDLGFVRAYPGYAGYFHDLRPGTYQAVFLLPGARYALIDSIAVRGSGLNHYAADSLAVFAPDSFSLHSHWFFEDEVKGELRELLELQDFHLQSYQYSGEGGVVEGTVRDETGEPLIGANVVLRKKEALYLGTNADFDGHYQITNVGPGVYDLEVSYAGYPTRRISGVAVASGRVVSLDVDMAESEIQLSAVMVTAYRVPLVERDMTSTGGYVTAQQIERLPARSVEEIAGKVAGIEEGDYIEIKGSRTRATVFYVDGIRVSGELVKQMDESAIRSVEVVTGASALAVFGPEAVGGVVLITTGAGKEEGGFDPASSIRSNFSDNAFWEPRLHTDREGRAVFRVTFPDDITRWRTFFPVMTGKRQSGLGEGSIRSFKPVAGRLSVPRFLIEGDTAWAIGRALNYTSDTLVLESIFSVNGNEAQRTTCRIAEAANDSVMLAPQGLDSLAVQFAIERADGYFDGELRQVAVFPKGIERVSGQFFVLDGDTAVAVCLPDSLGEATLCARADLLDVLEQNIARLVRYEYECNEQMASRLMALLAEEQIASFRGKTFDKEQEVNRLIARLEKNRNQSGLWGWWNQSGSVHWISVHVLEALARAQGMGYKVANPPRSLGEEAVWTLESNASNARKLEVLELVTYFNIGLGYDAYLPFIAQDTTLTPFDRLRLIGLQQRHGLPWERDSLEKYRRETIFGNVYYSAGEETYLPSRNTLQLTLSALRILQRDTATAPEQLRRIHNYLLECPSPNTYETAQIIEALLSGRDRDTAGLRAPRLALRGAAAQTVEAFPLEMRLAPGDTLFVEKTGDYPVYLTAWQRYWDSDARQSGDAFRVRSRFDGGGAILRAGVPVKLVVEVEVQKAAEYVLIEIPIPAGCSYGEKRSRAWGEVHREYFRHKTAIFCERLSAGTHRFEVELLPRYTGRFTLNPAKAELMYFPVFQGNGEGRSVRVE